MMITKRRALFWSLLIGTVPQVVQAQTVPLGAHQASDGMTATSPSPGSANSGLQEIVVTAQKRSQRLSDVGITISAPSAQELRSSGVTDVTSLNRVVPGFSSAETFAGFPVFSLRGVSFNAAQISAPPAVSVYLDEAALPYSAMTGGLLLDVERVEVLKGPQGTLFGQNATGGSINVIAAKPTSTFAAGLEGEANNFGGVNLDGYISGPVTDTLRARFAASTSQFGAWQRGYYLNDRKNGDQNRGAARLLLDWKPTDKLKIAVNLNANYDHGEAQQPQISQLAPVNSAGTYPGLLTYKLPKSDRDADVDADFDTHAHSRTYQAVVRLDYDFTSDVTLTSISDYINDRTRTPINLDATALPIIQSNYGGNVETVSQEVRLTGKVPERKINWVVGGNYEHDKIFDFQHSNFENYSGLPAGAQLYPEYHLTNRSLGAFANADWTFVERLTVTAGVRYTKTRQTIDGCTFDGGSGLGAATLGSIANFLLRAPAGLPPTDAYLPGGCITIGNVGANPQYLPAPANQAQRDHNVSWRAGLNYKPTDDMLLYGLVSRGYKSGIFPVQITLFSSSINPLKQERLTSYEVGFKVSAFNHRLQVNASGFYYDYTDKQFFTYVPTPPIGTTSTLVNIPKSKEKGVDLDVTATPMRGLTLRAAATYIDTQIGKFEGFNLSSQPVDFTGSEFNFAPPWSVTADAEYKFPVSSEIKASIGGGLLYNSRTFSDLGERPETKLTAYTIYNLRVGLESSHGWRVGLFARNLTNKYYWNNVSPAGDLYLRFSGQPRTFGGTFGFTF
jgi:outer membrane receptor protein involved in Fe transport